MLSTFGRLGGSDPFGEMRRLQEEMNRLFSDATRSAVSRDFPPVNLWLGEHSIAVTLELPGVGRNDVTIDLQEDVLTIHGERQPRTEPGDVEWHRRERAHGRFSRSIQLPYRVDPDKVEARFTNGILEIELQRPVSDRPRRIEIRAA